MQPVEGGTQKVTFNKEDSREYEALKRAAMAQADANPYVGGIGQQVKGSRDEKYGAPSVMPEQLIEGAASNFQSSDAPANSPQTDELNQTASLNTGVSATNAPQTDPQSMQSDALGERLALMRAGGQKRGYNDHSSVYGG